MFERSNIVLNNDILNKIKKSKILLVGLGGVGGITFEMLIRLGFEKITIVDYDIFEESNLNRQILSTRKNLGIDKTKAAYDRAKNINEAANIKIINEKLDINTINSFNEKYDYIIDACDDIKAKIELIKYAINNNIKIITACGTANRIDPSKIIITNIWKTNNDPLSKKLRHELRKENINYKLPVVTSTELPIKSQKLGSICLVPNVAGIFLVSYILNDILNS